MNFNDPACSIPILPSLNIAETADFYQQNLGFHVLGDFGDYLLLRRDQIELHFWLTDDKALPPVSACYIRGGQVPALFEEFQQSRFNTGKLSDFEIRPWNMKEFYVHDPHGNLLKFGCAPEEIE